jgi:hypothetical protein
VTAIIFIRAIPPPIITSIKGIIIRIPMGIIVRPI